MLNIKEQQRIYRHQRIRNGLKRDSPASAPVPAQVFEQSAGPNRRRFSRQGPDRQIDSGQGCEIKIQNRRQCQCRKHFR